MYTCRPLVIRLNHLWDLIHVVFQDIWEGAVPIS